MWTLLALAWGLGATITTYMAMRYDIATGDGLTHVYNTRKELARDLVTAFTCWPIVACLVATAYWDAYRHGS